MSANTHKTDNKRPNLNETSLSVSPTLVPSLFSLSKHLINLAHNKKKQTRTNKNQQLDIILAQSSLALSVPQKNSLSPIPQSPDSLSTQKRSTRSSDLNTHFTHHQNFLTPPLPLLLYSHTDKRDQSTEPKTTLLFISKTCRTTHQKNKPPPTTIMAFLPIFSALQAAQVTTQQQQHPITTTTITTIATKAQQRRRVNNQYSLLFLLLHNQQHLL